MNYEEFCEYFYKAYHKLPLAAQVDIQNKMIFHLRMELGKLKKQVQELSKNKEGKLWQNLHQKV